MDIQMPEVSGTEATRQIRQLPDSRKATIPIIALTANALNDDAERFMAAGITDYLAKPFEECKLFQKIAANLAQPRRNQVDLASIVEPAITLATISPSAPVKICKLAALQSMANGKNSFLIKFLQLFLDQVPLQVQALHEAAAHANWPKVNSLAHQLKSNFDTVGITILHQSIRKLETNARQQINLNIVPKLLATIQATVNQVITESKAELSLLKE